MKDKKFVGAPFPNAAEIVRVVYDFAEDGGATAGTLELLEAKEKIAVKLKHAHVLAAATSAGSATVSVGKGSSGDEFLDAQAVAGLTLNAALAGEGGVVYLAAGDKIEQNIATAALTAGKIEYVFEVIKAN